MKRSAPSDSSGRKQPSAKDADRLSQALRKNILRRKKAPRPAKERTPT